MRETYLRFSDEWFLEKYFRYGSVESVLKNEDSIPISLAGYHRLISAHGIVCSPGRHVSLREVLQFFYIHAQSSSVPLESIYQKMPHSFNTSVATLHRIYSAFTRNVTRRYATALAITSEEDHSRFLVGRELAHNETYGKKVGMWTVPMTFSKKNESTTDRVFRILQQEVSVDHAIEGSFAKHSGLYLKFKEVKPLFSIDVLDVKLSVFYIHLPASYLESFKSFKLADHTFMTMAQILQIKEGLLRPGMRETVKIAHENITLLKNNRHKISFRNL